MGKELTMLNNGCQVVGIGIGTIDYIMIVPSFPAEDTKNYAVRFIRQAGGAVSTALITLAKLGVRVGYIGKIGDDEGGRFIRDDFRRFGVVVENVILQQNAASLVAFVLVNEKNGKRTIVADRGTVSTPRLAEFDPQMIETAKFLHLDGGYPELALEAVSVAKKAGVKVSLDAGNVYAGMEKLVDATDILITSANFPVDFLGEADLEKAGREFLKIGAELVVITQGEQGCLVFSDGDTFHQPAFRVDVVDTTGAGDAFHGAFLYGLLQKWSVRRAAEFSCAVAAINCTGLGGRSGLPVLQEVEDFMVNHR